MNEEIAVVTGGTKGIGKQVALELAERGATVVGTYYSDDESAAEARAELDEYDTPTAIEQFDVSDFDEVKAAFDEIEDEYGPVTMLVNNAGIFNNGLLLRMDPEDWNQVVDTNLTGTFNCTKVVYRSMMLNDGGRIVNVSSVAGLRGWAGQSNYAATKAGIIGFTQSVAREAGQLRDKEIRVNAVAPGYTDTGFIDELPDDAEVDDDIPYERMAEPEEIARSIVYLLSDDAPYVHGEVHRIDGGLLA